MRIFTVDLLVMFVVLPILIICDSWRRLQRIGWEWVIFGFLAMSLFCALLQDIIYPLCFKDKNPFNLLFTRGITLGGAFIFFRIYTAVEEPILREGRMWRSLRALPAVLIGIVVAFSISEEALKAGNVMQAGSSAYGWLLMAGAVAFVITQIGTYTFRDKEKIAAYEKEREEKKKQKVSGPETAPSEHREQSQDDIVLECPQCKTPYTPDDYRREAPEWICDKCKNVLPKR